MKKSSLYFKLAFQNIKNNRKFYIPYLIAGMFTSMMCYILFYLLRDDTLNDSYDGATLMILREFMYVGIVITALFSVIVVFYTNSFLIKRRKRELGLYNILGMQKRNLAWIQVIETAAIAIVSVLGGVLCGMLFAKLTLLLLCKITGFDAPFGFHVDFLAIAATSLIFSAIYFIVLIYNVIQVGKARPVDLLRSEKMGQKPPKAKWALTVIGVLSLGAGYVMSLITENIMIAITLFLIAVVLVIIGTYCLFTSGSITILKAMQKSKRYYYKTAHFTGVSGMIYRMKANAVGLANICILSTMVLVTVSTTVALNIGAEDSINSHYPYDISYGIGRFVDDHQILILIQNGKRKRYGDDMLRCTFLGKKNSHNVTGLQGLAGISPVSIDTDTMVCAFQMGEYVTGISLLSQKIAKLTAGIPLCDGIRKRTCHTVVSFQNHIRFVMIKIRITDHRGNSNTVSLTCQM